MGPLLVLGSAFSQHHPVQLALLKLAADCVEAHVSYLTVKHTLNADRRLRMHIDVAASSFSRSPLLQTTSARLWTVISAGVCKLPRSSNFLDRLKFCAVRSAGGASVSAV